MFETGRLRWNDGWADAPTGDVDEVQAYQGAMNAQEVLDLCQGALT